MTEPLIDPSVFAELAEAMGEEFAGELVTTFLDEAPGMFADLHSAAAAGDEDTFRRAAHSIKSNAEVFGAQVLADEARAMELGALADGAAALPRVDETFANTATALRSLLDG